MQFRSNYSLCNFTSETEQDLLWKFWMNNRHLSPLIILNETTDKHALKFWMNIITNRLKFLNEQQNKQILHNKQNKQTQKFWMNNTTNRLWTKQQSDSLNEQENQQQQALHKTTIRLSEWTTEQTRVLWTREQLDTTLQVWSTKNNQVPLPHDEIQYIAPGLCNQYTN